MSIVRPCLGCKRLAHSRGLCRVCYDRLRLVVKSGQTTWVQLEAEGKSRPPNPEGKQRWVSGR